MNIYLKTKIDLSFSEVFKAFDQNLFRALKPPLINLEVLRFDGCEKGDEVHLQIKFGPLKQKWVSLITENANEVNESYFIDEGDKLPPPLKQWKHKHRVIKETHNTCYIVDDIYFSTNNVLLDILIYPAMYIQFWLRKPAYKKYFNS